MDKVKELVNEITNEMNEMVAENSDFSKLENKSAQRRARKQTLNLEKKFKQFRKLSVK